MFFVVLAFMFFNVNANIVDKVHKVPIDDTIYLKSGTICIGEVTEVSDKEIKYQRLGMNDGIEMVLNRNTVEKIAYSNGVVQQITPANSSYSPFSKTYRGAIIGFITSILGLIIAGIILGTVSIILGVSALKKISENPMYKGKGLATAAIVLGFLDIIGAIWVILHI